MSVSFTEIYNQALSRLDDPILLKTYKENSQEFYRVMYWRLRAAIADFTIPESTVYILQDYTEPVFYSESIEAAGNQTTFELSDSEIILEDALILNVSVDGLSADEYSITDNKIVFDDAVDEGSEVSVVYYKDGMFNGELSRTEQEILSLFVVKAWAEKERNFLLDIRRLISDKDFKLISEANSLREKNNWYTAIREEAENKMKFFSWKDAFSDRKKK